MPDVFLSYNREDQATARRFAEAFAAEGLDVWWDTTLRAGEAYDEVTEAALKTAKAVVVLWSKTSVVSRWVRAEATQADRNKTLLPAMIEPCERPIMFELIQTADLSGWDGSAAHSGWRAFLGDVRRFVGMDARPSPTAPPPKADASAPLLAVLAFDNLSGDPEMAYFSDGVSEEILDTISRGADLKVIARSSSFQLRGADKAVRRVVADLKATHLLDGTVRRAGQRVRISAHLVDCASETMMWSDRFDRELTDVFALQDEIAEAVAEALRRTFARQPEPGPAAPDAYERFLRAQALWTARSPFARDLDEIVALLAPVVVQTPTFARAWELLAKCRALMLRHARRLDQRASAAEAAHTALRLDPARVGGLIALAELEPVGAFAARERLLDQALAVAPNDAELNFEKAFLASSVGRRGEGGTYADRAHQLDPLMPAAQFWYVSSRLERGATDEAWRLAEDFRRRWPELGFQIFMLRWAAGYKRWDLFDAWAAAAQRTGLAQHALMAPALAHAAYLRAPDAAYADAFVASCRDELARTGTVDVARLGDLDEYGLGYVALELAEEASYDYLFDPDGPTASRTMALSILFIRRLAGEGMLSDRRFVRLCAKLGLVSYWLETDRWPDCADEVPYDFSAEARKAAAEGLARHA